MSEYQTEVRRLARRMGVALAALNHGGPSPLLTVLLAPVQEQIKVVLNLRGDEVMFEPVEQPLPDPTTDVLIEMLQAPAPAQVFTAEVVGTIYHLGCGQSHMIGTECPKPLPDVDEDDICLGCDRWIMRRNGVWLARTGLSSFCEGTPEQKHNPGSHRADR